MSYPIGARFEYKSKYSDDIIIGYIKEVGVGYYTPGMNKYVVSTHLSTRVSKGEVRLMEFVGFVFDVLF
jgi:hypothetical protein